MNSSAPPTTTRIRPRLNTTPAITLAHPNGTARAGQGHRSEDGPEGNERTGEYGKPGHAEEIEIGLGDADGLGFLGHVFRYEGVETRVRRGGLLFGGGGPCSSWSWASLSVQFSARKHSIRRHTVASLRPPVDAIMGPRKATDGRPVRHPARVLRRAAASLRPGMSRSAHTWRSPDEKAGQQTTDPHPRRPSARRSSSSTSVPSTACS